MCFALSSTKYFIMKSTEQLSWVPKDRQIPPLKSRSEVENRVTRSSCCRCPGFWVEKQSIQLGIWPLLVSSSQGDYQDVSSAVSAYSRGWQWDKLPQAYREPRLVFLASCSPMDNVFWCEIVPMSVVGSDSGLYRVASAMQTATQGGVSLAGRRKTCKQTNHSRWA